MKKITLALTLFLTFAAGLSPVAAQDYDDDLYYSPSKAAKEQKKMAEEIQRRRDEAIRKASSEQSSRRYYDDYESADKYATSAARMSTLTTVEMLRRKPTPNRPPSRPISTIPAESSATTTPK